MLTQQSGLLRIADEDNVFVLMRRLSAGERLQLCGHTVVCETPLGLGHKIAARDIAAGEKIVKYGAPIGSAVRDIALASTSTCTMSRATTFPPTRWNAIRHDQHGR